MQCSKRGETLFVYAKDMRPDTSPDAVQDKNEDNPWMCPMSLLVGIGMWVLVAVLFTVAIWGGK